MSTLMQGYIKDYRKELDSDIWMMPPLYHRVWAYLKYKVNYKEAKIPLKDGDFLIIYPGQHLTSTRAIAKGVGYYEGRSYKEPAAKTIKKILDWLKKQEMITVDNGAKGNQYTLITINNWSSYQGTENEVLTGNTSETPKALIHKDLENQDAVTSNTSHKKNEIELTDSETPVTGNTLETHQNHVYQGFENENGVTSNTSETLRKQCLPTNKKDKESKERKEVTTTTQEMILEMNNDDHLSDFERLENRYIELRGKGLTINSLDIQAIKKTLEQVPYDAAAYLLADCYKKRETINSFSYCQTYIISEYQKAVERQKAIQEEQQNKVVPIHSQTVIYDESSDEYKLADLLLRLIIKDQSDFTKPDIQKWASTFNAMLVEGKEAIHIQEVIVFARKSSFWKSKVLSPAELKRFYDRLRAQVQAEQAPNAGKRNQRVADMPKWMNEEQDHKAMDVESESNSNDDGDGQAELQALFEERKRRKQERGLKNGSYY